MVAGYRFAGVVRWIQNHAGIAFLASLVILELCWLGGGILPFRSCYGDPIMLWPSPCAYRLTGHARDRLPFRLLNLKPVCLLGYPVV